MNLIPTFAITTVLLSLAATAQGPPKPPTLDDYPAPVVEHLLNTFNAERDALREESPSQSDKELPSWYGCPSDQENAFPLYQKAFKAEVISTRLDLLVTATNAPCFEYPLSKQKLREDPVTRLRLTDIDLFGDVRNATRLLVDEARIRLTSGDTDGALEVLCASLGLLDHTAQVPDSTMQLTRYACQDLVMAALRDSLASVTLSDSQLARLSAAIQRANKTDALARSWIFAKPVYEDADPFEGAQTIHIFDGTARAQLAAAQTAMAVERYLQARGKCPETLADLVPDYLDAVPTDPMIGEPLRYEVNDTHFIVFSVGMDGEPMAAPFTWTHDDAMKERTVVLVPITKSMIPLGKMSLHFEHEPRPNTPEEQAAMQAVSDATISSLLHLEPRIVSFSAGPLEGGIAVLLASVTPDEENADSIPVMAGFWVREGALHTVNQAAKRLMPQLPAAPESITFTRLRDVVH